MTDAPNLLDYQGFSNGLAFGPGTDVHLVAIDGLRDTTQIASGDVAKARTDGASPGVNTMGERVLTLTFMVFAPSRTFESVLADITAAFQPQSNPNALQVLQFQLPEWPAPRQVSGRTTQGALPIDTDYQYFKGTVILQFTCPDPLIYESVAKSASSGLPAPTAGLSFPATPPFMFGQSVGGNVFVENGNVPAPFLMTITGPCTNPLMRLGSQYLGFEVTLAATDYLVIDTKKKTAMLNGTGNRTNTILTGSTWLRIPKGSSNIGISSTDPVAVAASFTADYTNTWGFM